MKFTVTMECEGCGQKFVGQDEHLVDAVSGMVLSSADGDHASRALNQELDALVRKANEVREIGVILDELTPLTQKQFEAFTQGKWKFKPEDPNATP